MKTLPISMAAVLALAVMVRAETTADDSQAKAGAGWSVNSDNVVRVPIGGIGYLAVEIKREGLQGPVNLSVAGLPEGISVREKDIVLADAASKTTITLVGAANLKEGTLAGPKVVATAGATKEAEFKIEVKDYTLHPGSALVMVISILTVLCLVSYCIWRVFTLPPIEVEEHLKGPLEIDTRDTQDAD